MSAGALSLLIVAAATAASALHSLRFRGPVRTAVFFAAALFYASVHEYLFRGQPYFFYTHDPVMAGPIPAVTPLFWVVMYYCAWWTAEYMVKPIPGKADSLFPTVYMIGVAVLAVSIAVLSAAGGAGLIVWNWSAVREHVSFWIPIKVFVRWTTAAVLFFIPLLLFTSGRIVRSGPLKLAVGVLFYFGFVYMTWIPIIGVMVFLVWLLLSWRIERVRLTPESLARVRSGP